MIARGDLAVELGWERLAEAQEEILGISEAVHVPVIWATQVRVLEDILGRMEAHQRKKSAHLRLSEMRAALES
jgi:hypothetical protein